VSSANKKMNRKYGHLRFYELTKEEEELHSKKNRDYAQGGDPLGNFRRVASILSLYPGLDLSNPVVVSIVYALKQWDAAVWSIAKGYSPQIDSRTERFQDDSIYKKLAIILDEEETVLERKL